MNGNAFRNAIEQIIEDKTGVSFGWVCGIEKAADDILNMPEMQAIREALGMLLDETPMGCPYLLQDGSEGVYGPNTCMGGCYDEPECGTHGYPVLQKPVIDWVREVTP